MLFRSAVDEYGGAYSSAVYYTASDPAFNNMPVVYCEQSGNGLRKNSPTGLSGSSYTRPEPSVSNYLVPDGYASTTIYVVGAMGGYEWDYTFMNAPFSWGQQPPRGDYGNYNGFLSKARTITLRLQRYAYMFAPDLPPGVMALTMHFGRGNYRDVGTKGATYVEGSPFMLSWGATGQDDPTAEPIKLNGAVSDEVTVFSGYPAMTGISMPPGNFMGLDAVVLCNFGGGSVKQTIAEVIVYNTKHDDQTRAGIEAYLAAKYGITT